MPNCRCSICVGWGKGSYNVEYCGMISKIREALGEDPRAYWQSTPFNDWLRKLEGYWQHSGQHVERYAGVGCSCQEVANAEP